MELTPLAARGELRFGGEPPSLEPCERARLVRRARLLAWGGNAWHVVEFGVAIVAGLSPPARR